MARRFTSRLPILVGTMVFAIVIGEQHAGASVLEKWLIMPGPVAVSHADIEAACDSCHDLSNELPQASLCIACHVDVGDDVDGGAGFHGRLSPDDPMECTDCHTEHEGRDADIVGLEESTFDHTQTDFELHGAHEGLACAVCHAPDEPHRAAPEQCVGCHRDDDAHEGQLGDACVHCHIVTEWSDALFNHSRSGFPLTGAHVDTPCQACHVEDLYTPIADDCLSCHRGDDVHRGQNGTRCDSCHITSDWTRVTFDHAAIAGFALAGGHRGLTCNDCHSAGNFKDLGGSSCASCHADDDVHDGRNGNDCGACHVDSGWSTVNFDHARDTGIALPDGHGDLSCTACHAGKIHEPIPGNCGGCHVDDDVHRGQLGATCESCHQPSNWTAQVLFEHDLTSFPLLGAHATVSCEACHASQAFHDAGDRCVDCHAADDAHGGALGKDCSACHNPTDWTAWRFDHDVQTSFALTGRHSDLACSACHGRSVRGGATISDTCSACHRNDDPHGGRFGNACQTCHSTATFSELEGL